MSYINVPFTTIRTNFLSDRQIEDTALDSMEESHNIHNIVPP